MNPVIELDISKEESHGQAFLDRGKPYRGTFHFEHTCEGLEKLLQAIRDVEHVSGYRPTLILEATGHYQSPSFSSWRSITIYSLLSIRSFQIALENPIFGKLKRMPRLLIFWAIFTIGKSSKLSKKRDVQLLILRYLTRQYEAFSKMCVQTMLQFQAVLDQVFPAYKGVQPDRPYSSVPGASCWVRTEHRCPG
ncbi:UNVERIFIED_CONTAM: hypothetical protein ABIC26_002037 [Paenibacillus sp. PvR008]